MAYAYVWQSAEWHGVVGEYPGDDKLSAGEVEYECGHDHRMAT